MMPDSGKPRIYETIHDNMWLRWLPFVTKAILVVAGLLGLFGTYLIATGDPQGGNVLGQAALYGAGGLLLMFYRWLLSTISNLVRRK